MKARPGVRQYGGKHWDKNWPKLILKTLKIYFRKFIF